MAEEKDDVGVLTTEIIRAGLQNIEKTLDGEGFAFSKLDVGGKGLVSLGDRLKSFQHVRYLDVSDNQVTDLAPAAGMFSLLSINAKGNKVAAVGDLSASAYLQALDVSSNAIAEPSAINIPSLTYLNMAGNKLASLGGFEALAVLSKLNVSGNQLPSLAGIGALGELSDLDASGNPIATTEGLEGLGSLQSLNLNDTEVAGFDGLAASALGSLKSLSLSNSKVESLDEVAKLDALPKLESLNLEGTEVAGAGDEYRLEVLVRLPRLAELDGVAVTRAERREATAEADRRAAEAAAAAAEAAAEAEEED